MALRFQPRTEADIKKAGLAPAGDYPFEVLQASEEISKKSGHPMIKVKLGIYNGERVGAHVYDYLIASMESKLRHFCDSTGLLAKYESGTLTAQDCVGRSGLCRLIIDDRDPAYEPKNAVKDYVSRKAKPLSPPSPKPATEPPDDVPF
jgi:hypothetical protein